MTRLKNLIARLSYLSEQLGANKALHLSETNSMRRDIETEIRIVNGEIDADIKFICENHTWEDF